MRDGIYKNKLDELLILCRKNLQTVNEDLIRRAYEFSLEAHRHDTRASGEPFFTHPYEVALIVAREIPLDDISVASALLHDVAEDTEYEIKDIRAEFGNTIADIVDGATKISDIFREHEVTKAENYRKMLLSMVNDIRVMLIKFADRLHNMRTLEYLPSEKRERLSKETLEIYAPFAHRFGLAKIKCEMEDLAFKYLYPKEYEEIAHQLKAKRREREMYIKKFINPIEKELKKTQMKFTIEGRPKHLYSIYNKMISRNKPLDEIYDLFAVRIILETDNPNDCFTAYGILTSIYLPIPERFKNYISVPKKNLYRSLHATVIGPDGKMVEVQIRTREMHEVAEKGVAAHWKYKEKLTALDEELENWISWVREIFEHPDKEQSAKQLIESFKLNLYQDEIYVFTPKGDLKILPKNATPVDFAFAVHTKVGTHCLGAKVNGKIVPLDYKLSSGDQVEIITSKKQNLSLDWEYFVVTHKAKSQIRKWLKEEEQHLITYGREQWEKKLKKYKLSISDDELSKYLPIFHISDIRQFYLKIYHNELNLDAVILELSRRMKHQVVEGSTESQVYNLLNKFLYKARKITAGITVHGSGVSMMHKYAQCCNPIPNDDIIGYVTSGEGIKIHRKSCKNIQYLQTTEPQRIIPTNWPVSDGVDFDAAIKIAGEDRPGILNEIAHSISTYQSTKIRAVKVDTKESTFTGMVIVGVKNTEHLQRVIERLRKVKGVSYAERFSD